MLTKDDATVAHAREAYEEVRSLDLSYVGFKDIGLPVEELTTLAKQMHADGKTVMLEVVSERPEDELRSARAALEIGADWLLGGTRATQVAPLLAGSGIVYCPFPGTVVGHPSKLRGSIEEIVASARDLAAIPGVGGLDLLAYRHDGDVEALVEAVAGAVDVPLITAGSIQTPEQIRAMERLGVWGFTIGGAVFDAQLPTDDPSVRGQVAYVLDLLAA